MEAQDRSRLLSVVVNFYLDIIHHGAPSRSVCVGVVAYQRTLEGRAYERLIRQQVLNDLIMQVFLTLSRFVPCLSTFW